MRIPQGQGGWLEDSLQVASLSFYYVGSREHQAARLSRKHLYHGVISPDQQCWFFLLFVCLFFNAPGPCMQKQGSWGLCWEVGRKWVLRAQAIW